MVGAIRDQLDVPKSTLTHHIAQLVATGLITQTREGRIQRCRIDPDRTRLLMGFMTDCCESLPGMSVPG